MSSDRDAARRSDPPPLRVHVQNIWPEPDQDRLIGPSMRLLYERTTDLIRGVLGEGVEVRSGFNPHSTYFTSCASFEAFNVPGLLAGLMTAEADGADVAIIACGNDPALAAARTALTIPVVGLTESAMLLACTLGRRFGVVTLDDASVPLVEANLERHGLEHRAVRRAPVRSAGFYEDISRWFRDPDHVASTVVPRFDAVARELITDGAEVIVTACGAYATLPIHRHTHVADTDVPILDATLAAAHVAGVLGRLRRDFGLSTSKHRTFKSLPAEIVDRFLPRLA